MADNTSSGLIAGGAVLGAVALGGVLMAVVRRLADRPAPHPQAASEGTSREV